MMLGAAAAADLTLALPPGAAISAEHREERGSYVLPVGPFAQGGMKSLPVEGTVVQTAWQWPGDQSTFEVLAPLRDQLVAAGFEVLFECEAFGCGGFDFRYGMAVLPEPQMHVDLGDFRYLAARRGAAEYVSLLISRSSRHGFAQITMTGPAETAAQMPVDGQALATATGQYRPAAATAGIDDPDGALQTLSERIAAGLPVPLEDLAFASGSADLAEGDFASLATLAEYLAADRARRVILVGHTDASGSLAANISLSQRRAASVVRRLADRYGITDAQVSAEGVGFLVPRASNLTPEGRTLNRRVEVVPAASN